MNLNSPVEGNGDFYAPNLLLGSKHLYSGRSPMYQPNYNMNSASRTQTNQMSILTNSVHPSPITSLLVNFGNDHICTLPFLVRDESSSFGKESNYDFISMFQKEPHQQCDELLQSIVDSSCAVSSTPFKEVKNPEKQRDLEIDLNKTPEQKAPKRRQLKPMVFSEEKFSNLPSPPLDESLSLYEETQENLVTIILDEESQKRHDELLKDLMDTLSAADIPISCGEMKELEKGSDQVIDLNKTPEQKPPKRRKHRPKVITEGKPKRSSKPVMPKDTKKTPSVKRKYVRKDIKESATPPVNIIKIKDSSTAPKLKSCKRTLNFDLEKTGGEDSGKKQDGKDVQGNIGNCFYITRPNVADFCTRSNGVCSPSSDVHISHQYEMMAENVQPTIRRNLADMDQLMTPFISQSERVAAADPLYKSAYCKTGNLLNDRKILDQRKTDQYQNGLHYGYTPVQQYIHEEGIDQFINQTFGNTHYNGALEQNSEYSQTVPKFMSKINEARGTKRGHSHTGHNTHLRSINALDSSLLCQEVTQTDECRRQGSSLNVRSLEIPGKTFESGIYETLYKSYSTFKADEGCSKHLNTVSCNSINPVEFTTEMKQVMLSGHVRSNQSTERQNNLPNEISGNKYINSVVYGNKYQGQQISHELHPNVERTSKTSGLTKVTNYGSLTTVEKCNELQPFPHLRVPKQDYAFRHSDHSLLKKRQADQLILSKLGLLATEEVQERDYSFGCQQFPGKTTALQIHEIISQLKDLNLDENERIIRVEQNAIVPYKGNGAVIPYVESEYIKKRKPRPRVDLDPETERIWNLLMGNEGSEGLEDHEKDKEKWWEEERKVFRGRADSFIARMHLVQGDRRFSQWKGSVVDSVIGVFLTQNVSDHLSSSAFMSLAARFPIKSTCKNRPLGGVGPGVVTNKSAACQLYPKDLIRWNEQVLSVPRLAMSQNSMNHHNHRGNSGTVNNFTEVHSQIVKIQEEEVISSQDSIDSTITQVSGGARSCSGSNSEAEDPIVSYNGSSISISNFNNTKQTVTTTMSQKSFSNLNRSSTFDRVSELRDWHLPDGKQDSLTSEWKEIDDLNGHSLFSFLINIENQQKQAQVASSNSNLHMTPDHGGLEVEGCEALSEETISSGSSIAWGSSTEKNTTCHSLNIGELADTLGKTRAKKNGQARSQETVRMEHGESAGKYSVHLQSIGIQLGSHCGENLQLDNYRSCERNKTFPLESALVTDLSEESVAQAKKQSSTLGNVIHVPGHREKSLDQEDRIPRKSNQINFVNNDGDVSTSKAKRRKFNGKQKNAVDWDSLRRQVETNGQIKEKAKDAMDSIDYEAIRLASVHEISDAIKERGMNNMLAARIKDFLNRLVTEHGSIDLEWLREVSPDKVKDYLLSVRGLGLKSVECVRLLTLRHLAFPVDTNVGRIAVRLGWVPLKPLPESLQLHLLELYPVLESIQKYLWPRLCKLDQRTLYELHYQLITFGKVFCTKSKPNCNACPMRGECKHFASAFASARLALPGPDERRIVSSTNPIEAEKQPTVVISPLPILLPETSTFTDITSGNSKCEPIVEVPATPEQELNEISESDIEDSYYDDPDEIPTIKLSLEEFKTTLQNYIPEGDMSKALVSLNPEAASIPMPKLKNVSRLRTEHRVYELPDSHPLLNGMDRREPDDPSPYLLAIWTPGETANSIQPPEQSCGSNDPNRLCNEETCFTCSSRREANSQTVRGTLLIPCRTAMRGSFPLNGTYFQVNEMFADHESSLNPIDVPRAWLWNLPRRTVYFGTSVSTIFKGLSTEGIQQCFWRGFVCVRGFDHKTRAPRPLIARLHFPASKLAKIKNGQTE